ncbi:hypothetical protein NU08_4092 [Flavobacterium anhuiense]|uniref:Uncharacterized protein n=1 Tax=Flavobacterium anhuiense TaxID=459526 RepID=A0A444VT79_9FLAO|nr:hypothetical protein NU08_4092 [Flavobacterium anhuiense]
MTWAYVTRDIGAPFVGTAAWQTMQLLSIIVFTSLSYVTDPAGALVFIGAEESSFEQPARIMAANKTAHAFCSFITCFFSLQSRLDFHLKECFSPIYVKIYFTDFKKYFFYPFKFRLRLLRAV